MYRPPPGDYSLFHAPGRRTQKGLQALQASAVQVTLHGLVWFLTSLALHAVEEEPRRAAPVAASVHRSSSAAQEVLFDGSLRRTPGIASKTEPDKTSRQVRG
eukprot:g17221.t1